VVHLDRLRRHGQRTLEEPAGRLAVASMLT
jgi:hypothetical protein